MRIAFDGTTLTPGRTGVGYYSEHLLHHLAQQGGGDGIAVISNRAIETARPLPPAVTTHVSRWHAPRLVWMQAEAPRALRRLGVDVAHFTNGMMPVASPVPTVVTIHDMSLSICPHYHPWRRVLLNRPLVDLAARRADVIVTVSQSAKTDIVRHYRLDPRRVHVVHEAAAPEFQPIGDVRTLARVRAHYGLAERIVLYVGTIEPRKNLPRLLEGFAARRRRGDLEHQLVCVGPYGWLSRDLEALIDRLRIADAVRFTGYVPFADLPVIYTLAEMLVFPSVYEGFGLPVIEAMACGTPVITGQVAALEEVGGRAVDAIERLDADAIGDAIVRLARSTARRQALRAAGLERARTFSWDRAARETLAAYAAALERATAPSAAPAAWMSGLR